MLKEKKKKFK